MKTFLSILCLAAFFGSYANAKQLQSIKITEMEGQVLVSHGSQVEVPATLNQVYPVGTTFITRASGTARLVLSNGSILQLDEETEITLDSFEQDNYSGNRTFSQLRGDPSISKAVFTLEYGTVTGHARRLLPDSEIRIESMFGTTLVKGTIFITSITINPETDEITFALYNAEGTVLFEDSSTTTRPAIMARNFRSLLRDQTLSRSMTLQQARELRSATSLLRKLNILVRRSQLDAPRTQRLLARAGFRPTTHGPESTGPVLTFDNSLIVVSPETGAQ